MLSVIHCTGRQIRIRVIVTRRFVFQTIAFPLAGIRGSVLYTTVHLPYTFHLFYMENKGSCRILNYLRLLNVSFIYSKKFVMSLLEHRDHATPIASTSKVGVITCRVSPSRLLQPIFSVSWYIPKLNRIYDRSFKIDICTRFIRKVVRIIFFKFIY